MSTKTYSSKRRKYDEDFKTEVLKMVDDGQPISQISQALGISENLIYGWKSKRKGKQKEISKGEKSDFSLKRLKDNEPMKARIKQLEVEREILKKALRFPAGTIFSQTI